LPCELVAARDLIETALQIAIETERSVYDALDVAAAVQSQAVLLTADRRLVNALAATPFKAHVRHLAKAR
jgi:predicted nucleic acid-binding protein